VHTWPASDVTPSRRRDRETFDATDPSELSDSWLPLRSRHSVVPTGMRLMESGPRRDGAARDTLESGANRPNVGTHWKYLQPSNIIVVILYLEHRTVP